MSSILYSHHADSSYSYPNYAQPLSNPIQATSALTGIRVKLENAPVVRARQAPRLTVESPSDSASVATATEGKSVDPASRSLTPDSDDDDGTVCTPVTAVASSKNETETSPPKGAI